MNPLKSDTATAAEADWSFAEDAELMAALEAMVAREARAWSLPFEDALQEAYLWLAVRPNLANQETGLAVNSARQRVAQLRETSLNRRKYETSLEEEEL